MNKKRRKEINKQSKKTTMEITKAEQLASILAVFNYVKYHAQISQHAVDTMEINEEGELQMKSGFPSNSYESILAMIRHDYPEYFEENKNITVDIKQIEIEHKKKIHVMYNDVIQKIYNDLKAKIEAI